MYADLHTHTTASDGTVPPDMLVERAAARGITLLAITDHDTIASVAVGRTAARAREMGFIAGVELSCGGLPGRCHLLGLGINDRDETLQAALAKLSRERHERNEAMVTRLNALGLALTLAEVTAVAPPGAEVGRPHFAQTLIQKGYVQSTEAAFTRYLADNAPGYVPRVEVSVAEAIAMIHAAGGLAFLAHPGVTRLKEQETIETRLVAMREVGMDGVEVYHSAHTPRDTAKFAQLAQKLALLTTGGSDFHGDNKPDVRLGKVGDDRKLPITALSPELVARAETETAPVTY